VASFVVLYEDRKGTKCLFISDEPTAPEAAHAVKVEHSGSVITNVYIADNDLTPVCILHGNHLPCAECDGLSGGKFSSEKIDLAG
jgi:hypothetical protein